MSEVPLIVAMRRALQELSTLLRGREHRELAWDLASVASSTHLDGDVPRLFDMIEPIRKVKAILYGHSHVY